MANTLTSIIPLLYSSMDVVSREMVGFIPAVFRNSTAEQAALNQTINYPIAQPATAQDITPGLYAPDTGDQTVLPGSITITKSRSVPIRWNGEEQRSMINGGFYSQLLQDQFTQAFRTLVNEIEAALYVTAYQNASRAYGTAGTTPFGTKDDLSDISQVRKILVDNGAGSADLRLVLGTTAGAQLRGKMSNLFKANEAGSAEMLRTGALGPLEGLMIGESAAVVPVTKGTGASYVTSGSTAAGVKDIALVTGTGTALAGDIVTFAADGSNKYVIGTGVAAPGTISLNAPGALMTIPTANAMTIAANSTRNMAFRKGALHLVTRAPAMPVGPDGKPMDTADDVMDIMDPVSGLVFQVALYRQYRQIQYQIGIAYGTSCVKDEHVAVLLG